MLVYIKNPTHVWWGFKRSAVIWKIRCKLRTRNENLIEFEFLWEGYLEGSWEWKMEMVEVRVSWLLKKMEIKIDNSCAPPCGRHVKSVNHLLPPNFFQSRYYMQSFYKERNGNKLTAPRPYASKQRGQGWPQISVPIFHSSCVVLMGT